MRYNNRMVGGGLFKSDDEKAEKMDKDRVEKYKYLLGPKLKLANDRNLQGYTVKGYNDYLEKDGLRFMGYEDTKVDGLVTEIKADEDRVYKYKAETLPLASKYVEMLADLKKKLYKKENLKSLLADVLRLIEDDRDFLLLIG